MVKYTLYIGCNDKDKKVQVIKRKIMRKIWPYSEIYGLDGIVYRFGGVLTILGRNLTCFKTGVGLFWIPPPKIKQIKNRVYTKKLLF